VRPSPACSSSARRRAARSARLPPELDAAPVGLEHGGELVGEARRGAAREDDVATRACLLREAVPRRAVPPAPGRRRP
jgi:hypothetical protein